MKTFALLRVPVKMYRQIIVLISEMIVLLREFIQKKQTLHIEVVLFDYWLYFNLKISLGLWKFSLDVDLFRYALDLLLPFSEFFYLLPLEAMWDFFQKYNIKTHPNMCMLMYFKIQSDQTRIMRNALRSQIFYLFTKSSMTMGCW